MLQLSREVVLLVIWMMSVLGYRSCPEKCKVWKNPTRPACNIDTKSCFRGCVHGYYGNTCRTVCDVNCEQGKCQRKDGLCTCKDGYTFNNGSCESRSGMNYRSNEHCLNNKCVFAGRRNCLEGCKPGWFGDLCQQPCSPKCVCDRVSGNCTSCLPGWYGVECESRCSEGCVDNNCHRNGTCVGGCRKKYIGKMCELTCPEQCHDGQCDNNGTCDTCMLGFYGTSCRQTCHRCTAQVCEKITGECQSGCQSGFYGERCTESCGKCTDQACNQTTGACIKGCQTEYFGPECTKKCEMCKGRACNQTTGACTKGCPSGHYGSFCRKTCENCLGGECDQDTGECSGKWTLYIIGGGLLFVVLVLAGFIACCLIRMRDIVKDGVDTIGQNTAVQFLPGHGNPLRSIELGNTDTNASGTNPDDTYNHLGAFKPPETTFSLANDDLETASGYCAVLPLFSGLSCQHLDESVDGSGGGSDGDTGCGSDKGSDGESNCESDGGSETGRSIILLCDNDASEITLEEAKAVVEKVLVLKPIQVVTLTSDEKDITLEPINILPVRPDRENLTPKPMQIADIRPDTENLTPKPMQIVDIRPDTENLTPKPIQIVDIRPDREKRTPEPIQVVDTRPDSENLTLKPIKKVDIRPDRKKRTPEPNQIVDVCPHREKRTLDSGYTS